MRKTTGLMLILGAILLLFGIVAGCGKNENKYIGTYICKENEERSPGNIFQTTTTIIIKPDRTVERIMAFQWTSWSNAYVNAPSPSENRDTVTWEPLSKDKIRIFYDSFDMRGKDLRDFSGRTYVKQ